MHTVLLTFTNESFLKIHFVKSFVVIVSGRHGIHRCFGFFSVWGQIFPKAPVTQIRVSAPAPCKTLGSSLGHVTPVALFLSRFDVDIFIQIWSI